MREGGRPSKKLPEIAGGLAMREAEHLTGMSKQRGGDRQSEKVLPENAGNSLACRRQDSRKKN
jgi:hypothetical protein